MKWHDDSAMASKFPVPRTVFHGQLIGGEEQEIVSASHGLSMWDGKFHTHGMKNGLSGNETGQMWGVDGVGIFRQSIDASPANTYLRKSKTGYDDWDTITDLTQAGIYRDSVGRSLIDCGYHTFDYSPDAHGSIRRRVLLYCEYVDNPVVDGHRVDAGKIWFSVEPDATAGDVGTWHELFPGMTVMAEIRHFHGGIYVRGKGLYVFTGDSDVGSSILYCPEAEIDNLINASVTSATTYFDHWCLGDGDRDLWSGDYSDDWILGGNSQDFRTVDMLTVDSKYGYYISDTTDSNGHYIRKVDFFDGATNNPGSVADIGSGGIPGVGWYGVAAKNGLIYITTGTWWNTDDWLAGSNGYSEIWCIDPEDDSCAMVKHAEVRDPDPPDSTEIRPNYPPIEYGGTIFVVYPKQFFGDFIGDIPYRYDYVFAGYCQKQKKIASAMNTNGSFESGNITGFTFDVYTNKISYDNGVNQINVSDVVVGVTSGASATVSAITTTGAWDGSAYGVINFTQSTISGVFIPDETIKVGSTNSADIVGIATTEVIADPTGGIGGNVLRVVLKNSDLTNTANLKFAVDISSANQEALSHQAMTFGCKIYIAGTSDDATTFSPSIYPVWTPGGFNQYRNQTMAFTKDAWHSISSSIIAGDTGMSQMRFYLDGYANDDDDYAVYYLTDFQIIAGAIRNDEIEEIDYVPSVNEIVAGMQAVADDFKANVTLVDANLTSIDGQATNGNNATLKLKKLSIVNDHATEAAFEIENVSGPAIKAEAGGQGDGFEIRGAGSGAGLDVIGGSTGSGIRSRGGSSSGSGMLLMAQGGNSSGLHASGDGSGSDINAAAISANITQVAGEATTASRLAEAIKFIINKTTQDKSTGVITVYDNDGTTPLLTITPTDDGSVITKARS